VSDRTAKRDSELRRGDKGRFESAVDIGGVDGPATFMDDSTDGDGVRSWTGSIRSGDSVPWSCWG
jgi:hypothetical protein